MSLPEFRAKIQEYRRAAGLTQKALARELGLHPNVLSHKLHETDGLRLTHGDIKRTVAALAKFQAIGTRGQAVELLGLMGLKPSAFSDPEWNTPPLRQLENEPVAAPRPSAAPAAPRHNLPVAPTALVGRDDLLARVSDRLSEPGVRLLTLTGLGGIGKTRLAVEVARRLLPDFPDGVTFVSLVGVSDAGLVASEIAHTLGVSVDGSETPNDALRRALSARTALLVLDNFEHVLAAAPLIGEVLGAAPDLKILVTSRAVLKVYGEHQIPVPPLELPDMAHVAARDLTNVAAVALFAERSRAVRPDFSLNDSNARIVAEICVRLNGLPLALELAAAKGKLFGPAALLQRLDQSLSLLSGASGGATQRQHTLRDTIAWSYHLLNADEQRLFKAVALFPGGCVVEAVEAVCGAGLDVQGGLISVLDKSLITQREGLDGQVRFIMLETLREFALEQLAESGELPTSRAAQTAYYKRVTKEMIPRINGAEQVETISMLESELDNIRAVMAWTLVSDPQSVLQIGGNLFMFWQLRGYLTEGRYWLNQALKFPPPAGASRDDLIIYGDAQYTSGTLAYWQGAFTEADTLLNAALALWRAIDDPRRAANALNNLGNLAWDISELELAHERYFEGLEIARKIEDGRQLGSILSNIGSLYWQRENMELAEQYLREAMAIRREMGDKNGIAIALSNLAGVLVNQEKYEQAALLFHEGMALHAEIGDRRSYGMSLDSLGTVAFNMGDIEQAVTYFSESLAIQRETGYLWGETNAGCNLGLALLARGDVGQAVATLNEALTRIRPTNDRLKIALALQGLGAAALDVGDLDAAVDYLREAITLSTEVDDSRGIVIALSCYAAVIAARGDLTEAARLWGAAEQLRADKNLLILAAERLRYGADLDAARAALPPADFDAAWDAGRALGWQAVYAPHEDKP